MQEKRGDSRLFKNAAGGGAEMRPAAGFLEGQAGRRGSRSCSRGMLVLVLTGRAARRGGAGRLPSSARRRIGVEGTEARGLCLVAMGGDGVATGAAIYSGQGVR